MTASQEDKEKVAAVGFVAFAVMAFGGPAAWIAGIAVAVERAFGKGNTARQRREEKARLRQLDDAARRRERVAAATAWLDADAAARKAHKQAVAEWKAKGSPDGERPNGPSGSARVGTWFGRTFRRGQVAKAKVTEKAGQFKQGWNEGYAKAKEVRANGGSLKDIVTARPDAPVTAKPADEKTAPTGEATAGEEQKPAPEQPTADASATAKTDEQSGPAPANGSQAAESAQDGPQPATAPDPAAPAAPADPAPVTDRPSETPGTTQIAEKTPDTDAKTAEPTAPAGATQPTAPTATEPRAAEPAATTTEPPAKTEQAPAPAAEPTAPTGDAAKTGQDARATQAQQGQSKDELAETVAWFGDKPAEAATTTDNEGTPTMATATQSSGTASNLDALDRQLRELGKTQALINEQIDQLGPVRQGLKEISTALAERAGANAPTKTKAASDAGLALVAALDEGIHAGSTAILRATEQTVQARTGLQPARNAEDLIHNSGAKNGIFAKAR
ncbi:hypothetical protein [Micromonospora sp. NPDC005652]|uniref:hypothetical protein n=1 Tax=Micromonospora sp. NPDC005652 TaxID=3157046 RepID=UPI0033FBFB2A